jgi:K+-transporting ATPase KdpF subunit
MAILYVIGASVSIALAAYLFFAMLAPEKFE